MKKIHPAVRCLFILPAVLWFFAAVIVPVLMAVYYSFFSWDGVTAKVFIRFDNYRELFKDPVVWKSLTNSLKMAFWCVLLQLPIGMAFSVILFNRKLKGRGFFRTVYFLPVVLSSSMIGILWGQIYDPNFGLLNGLLEAVGLKQLQQIWLGDMKLALGCIIAVVVWQFIGNYILIYYTALHNISEDVLESARLDGANDFVILFKIILPLSKATMAVMVLFYAVAHWSSWFNAMIYLRDKSKFPLQLVMREILIANSSGGNSMMDTDAMFLEEIAGAGAVRETLRKYLN